MQIGFLAVEKISIRLPDQVKHFHGEADLVVGRIKC